jgi:hypothetical protein
MPTKPDAMPPGSSTGTPAGVRRSRHQPRHRQEGRSYITVTLNAI